VWVHVPSRFLNEQTSNEVQPTDQTTSLLPLCAPEGAASILESDWLFPLLAVSLRWRTKRMPAPSWLRACKTVPWMMQLCGATSRPSMAGPGVERWILSLRASRAKISARPENVPASWRVNAPDSGSRYFASYGKWTPDIYFWKTSNPSLFEDSTSYSGAWPKQGLMRAGVLYRQPKQRPRTSANGPLSWRDDKSLVPGITPSPSTATSPGGNESIPPSSGVTSRLSLPRPALANRITPSLTSTPSVMSGKEGTLATKWPTPRVSAERNSRSSLTRSGHWAAPALEQAAELASGELPREYASTAELTPQARRIYDAAKVAQSNSWPTPRAEERRQRNSRDDYQALSLRVNNWPTPTAKDSASSANATATRAPGAKFNPGMTLTDKIRLWPTPDTVVGGGGGLVKGTDIDRGIRADGSKAQIRLQNLAKHLVMQPNWPTPQADDARQTGGMASREAGRQMMLNTSARIWPSPRASDGEKGGPNQHGRKGDLMLPSAAFQLGMRTTSASMSSTPTTSPPINSDPRLNDSTASVTTPPLAPRRGKRAKQPPKEQISMFGEMLTTTESEQTDLSMSPMPSEDTSSSAPLSTVESMPTEIASLPAHSLRTLWPTPDVSSAVRDMSKVNPDDQKRPETRRTVGLPTSAAYWPTPQHADGERASLTLMRGVGNPTLLGAARSLPKRSAPSPDATSTSLSPETAPSSQPTIDATDSRPPAESASGSPANIPSRSDSLWPTPAARDYRTPNTGESQERRNEGSTRGQQLPNYVAHQWPTPMSRDWRSGLASDRTFGKNSRPLTEIVARWTTPTTAMSGMYAENEATRVQRTGGRSSLANQAAVVTGSQTASGAAVQQGGTSRWPTPQAQDDATTSDMRESRYATGRTTEYLSRTTLMWPTPVANDDNKSPEAHLAMKARMPGGPRHAVTSLNVLSKIWRAPSASPSQKFSTDPTSVRRNSWSAPGSMLSDENSSRSASSKSPAVTWPTPRVCEGIRSSGSNRTEIYQASLPLLMRMRSGQASSRSTRTLSRRLNQAFVGWLMSWPVGWSDVYRPLGSMNFASWGTASSQLLRRLHYSYYPDDFTTKVGVDGQMYLALKEVDDGDA
jgi:hypothetical protein